MKIKRIRRGDIVRILKYSKTDVNAYGRVNGRINGKWWVVNGNMPFCGTVNDFFTNKEIRKE